MNQSLEQLSRNESSESLISSPSYSQKSAPVSEELDDCQQRPRSNTLSEIKDLAKDSDDKSLNRNDSLAAHQSRSAGKKPLLNIFMKVGSQTKLNFSSTEDLAQKTENSGKQPPSPPSGSWRQAIFNRIHLSHNTGSPEGKKASDQRSGNGKDKTFEMNELPKKKTKEELRDLWRSAIKQQMILIKMDKQNQRLQGKSS